MVSAFAAAGRALRGITHHFTQRLSAHGKPGAVIDTRTAVDPGFLQAMRTLYGPDIANGILVDLGAEAARIADAFDPDTIDWSIGARIRPPTPDWDQPERSWQGTAEGLYCEGITVDQLYAALLATLGKAAMPRRSAIAGWLRARADRNPG